MMTEQVINGKTLEVVWNELTAVFSNDDLQFRNDAGRKPYFPKEVYYERLYNVVGHSNTRFTVLHPPTLVQVGTAIGFTCVIELRIYSDSGLELPELFRTGIGYYDVIFYNSGNDKGPKPTDGEKEKFFSTADDRKKPKSVKDSMLSCVTNAKKSALRDLFGAVSYASNYHQAVPLAKKQEEYTVTLKAPFNEQSGNRYYSTGSLEGRVIDLLIWKDNLGDIKDRQLNSIMSANSTGKTVILVGALKDFNQRKQLHITGVKRAN